jgi:beta-lactamase regulating signal transducer with metallopeptidase domain
MSPTFISSSGALVILSLLAKATLLLVSALGVAAVLRRAPAGARHLVWLAVLASVLVLPVIARWAPLRLEVLPAAVDQGNQVRTSDASAVATAALGHSAAPVQQPQGQPTAQPEQRSHETRQAAPSWFAQWRSVSWWQVALGAWIAVAAALLAWLAYGAWSVRRIVRDAEPLTGSDWTDALYEAADRLDLEQSPRLLASDRIEMPFACGLLHPTIVLPASATSWNEDLRRTVLFHELAHVRRRDLVGHTVGRFACALYWFHPLVWTAAKRLRAESERACDDLVLSCGARASDYAEHLLRMVIGVRRHGAPALALPMARRKEFEGRVVAILDPAIRRQAPGRWQSASVIGLLAVLCLTIGAVSPAARRASQPSPVVASLSDTSLSASRSFEVADRTPLPRPTPNPSVMPNAKAQVENHTNIQTDTRISTRTESTTSTTPPSPRVSASVGRVVNDAVTRLLSSKGMAVRDTDPSGSISSRDRIALLVRLARTDDDASVRKTAVWALADAHGGKRRASDDDNVEGTLINVLREDDSDEVREMAAWALEQFDGADVMTALSSAARRDKSAEVRETALWALASKDAASSLDAFISALSDESHEVRATAIWGIGTVEPKRAPAGLVRALEDEDEDVRLRAAWALGQIVDPSTGDALVAAFRREQKSDVRSAELRALAFLGEQSKSVLDAALSSNDADLRARAVQILAGRGPGVWPWPWPQPRPRPNP